jgi:hypothetical protein
MDRRGEQGGAGRDEKGFHGTLRQSDVTSI